MFNLDHEMFHVQNEHVKKLIFMKFVIPSFTELVTFPIAYALYKNQNKLGYFLGILSHLLSKWILNTNLEILHRRYLESKADDWALQKSTHIDELNGL